MSHRERVLAALAMESPSEIPVGFWAHNFMRENSAEDLATETVRFALALDLDFAKVQSRFSCFAEVWGVEWGRSSTPTDQPPQVHAIATSPQELVALPDLRPDYRPLGEQVTALQLIRAGMPDDRPVIMTVFSPLMVAQFMLPESPDPRTALLDAFRTDPQLAAAVLAAITPVVRRFAADCMEAGADGVFYACNLGSAEYASEEDLAMFERPYGLQVMREVDAAPFNMVHVCGSAVRMHSFADYPTASFSWALGSGNPSLPEGQSLTGKAVAGGISAKPDLRTMSEGQARVEAMAAIASTGGTGLLIAPGCSVNLDTPPANIAAVVAVAHKGALGNAGG